LTLSSYTILAWQQIEHRGRSLMSTIAVSVNENISHRNVDIYNRTRDCVATCRIQIIKLEMWANAQRDDRPTEYR